MQNLINTYIVEEHHEAYIIWKYALANKFIKAEKNTLLHLDEHSDMSSPTFNVPIVNSTIDLNKIKEFTYNELSIATFIVPAIYENLFGRIYWIKQRHEKPNKKGNNLYVRSFNNTGKKLIVGRRSLIKDAEDEDNSISEDLIPFQFYKQHIYNLGKVKNVVLDIDLDYFSCVVNPLKKELIIEITKEEYTKFNTNMYHRIKYYDFIRVESYQENERYYYCFNRSANVYKSPLQVDQNEIIKRIDGVIEILRDKKIIPQIITICRSRFSGYTPNDQWEFIEKKLISKLNEIYVLGDIKHISNVV